MDATNGKASTPLSEPSTEFDWLDKVDRSLPIKPKKVARYGPAYRYYRLIRPQLQDWWNEFCGELDETGNVKYRSIKMFAQAKGTNPKERAWIEGMIGKEPELPPGERLRVPWLGDWYLRRLNGAWCPEQPKAITHIVSKLRGTCNNWEAVKSAAPFLVVQMARCVKMQEQLDLAFAGQPWNFNFAPDDMRNQRRSEAYFQYQGWIYSMFRRAYYDFMRAHGIEPVKVENKAVINVQQTIEQNGVNIPITMQEAAYPPPELSNLSDQQMEVVKLAQHLDYMMSNYRMNPPAGLLPPQKEAMPEPPPLARPTGKTQ